MIRTRWLAAALAVVMVAGAATALEISSGSKPGRLLVLATVELPTPVHAPEVAAQVLSLRIQESGGGWTQVGVPAARFDLPGGYIAPNTASLLQAEVGSGSYVAADLELRTASGRLDVRRAVGFQVTPGQMTPLLFTFALSAGATQPVAGSAYGGNSQVTFGLALASKQIQAVPNTQFTDQQGRPIRLSQYRGKVVVLASFLTECQETCPLVAAALLQLQKLLQQHGLADQVQILEATQDPSDDTPTILTKYQRYFALPWPLLTGSTPAIDAFWSKLGVPPVQALPWGGPAPTDLFTGRPEPSNLIHASVLEVINPQGYIVTVMQSQPTLDASSLPATIYSYLDAQGRSELKAGGAWTPQTVYQAILPLLQQQRQVDAFPNTSEAVPGKMAPDFTLTSTTGAKVTLAELRGHPVMLDFWASWCTNCRADMGLVAGAAREYGSRGLQVILINDQQSAQTVRNFLTSLHVALPSLLDSQGSVAQEYGLPGLPVAVFVQSDGRISSLVLGQLQSGALRAAVQKLLAA